jgi:eukaryotic-like serine/threonine-protein kinase
MTLSAGTRLGPYEVRSFLSAGGMGEVYAAFDPRLGRQVAIKVLTRPLAELSEFRRRFEQEIQTISRLNHKNICTVFDTGTHEGRPYIVMELMEGKTLEEVLAEGPMDAEAVVQVGIQVAAAIDAAHREGVIHRDVKSGNIFLNDRGDAKVLDFGIAKVAAEADAEARAEARAEGAITRTGTVVGTVTYMSPEQARGEDVDARSDLFSLGVVLYEMATGLAPFRGTNTAVVAQLVSPDPVPSPRALRPSIPAELGRIICRALEKDREMRYQTAADLLAALRALRRDLATGAISAGAEGSRGGRGQGRRRFGRLPMAGAGLAVVVLAVVAWRLLAPSTPVNRPIHTMAVLPCSDQQAAGTEYLCSLIAERIITSLSQVPGLTVKSFQAVEPYVGYPRGAIKAGSELGVDAVLTAQVRKEANALNAFVEVTDVRSGFHVWSSLFTSPAAEAQGLPEKIALAAAQALQLRISATDQARLRVLQTYQSAQYYWNDRTASSLRKAISLFNEVIQEDSTFAPAYVGLASAYTLLHYYGDLSPAQSYPRARAAAEKALQLNEGLADAHANLGLVERDYDRDWQGAEREFKRALQLNPKSATALQWYAELLTMTGRFGEAETRIREAQEAAPLSLTVRAVHGWILTSAGRFREARAVLDSTIAMDQDFELSHWFLGQLDFAQRDYTAAVKAFETSATQSGRLSRRLADLASAEAFAGHKDRTRELLSELEQRRQAGRYVSDYDMAIILAGLGEKDRAFKELSAALDERMREVADMAVDPMLIPLHSDPRFKQLLVRAGLGAG